MEKEEWSGMFGFILASIASAIGIGNIWRFPYIMGVSGGGAFVFAYLVVVIVIGLPLMLLEFSAGKRFRLSAFNTFKKIDKKYRALALIPVVTVFFIMSYYLVITGWTLSYSIDALTGNYKPFDLFANSYLPLIFAVISLFVPVGIVMFGVRRGIENSSKILIPVLFLILIIIVIQTLSFPNSIEGIKYYFNPDFSKLVDYRIWLLASAQALFSLSVGYGILLTYGSYTTKKIDILKSSLIIVFSDTIVALLAAVSLFATIYSFNLPPSEGTELAFVVLPQIFQAIKFGSITGPLFFLLLFIAAVTSVISMLEVVVKNVKDYFSFSRAKATMVVLIPLLLVSSIVSLSYTQHLKVNLLEIMDNLFGNFMTLISAFVISVFLSWKIKRPFEKEMGIKGFLYHTVEISIKFVIPIMLAILLLIRLFGE